MQAADAHVQYDGHAVGRPRIAGARAGATRQVTPVTVCWGGFALTKPCTCTHIEGVRDEVVVELRVDD
jgi:hypothetical protein